MNLTQIMIVIYLSQVNLMDEQIYLGFAVLQLSKLLRYEIYYDKFQPLFGEKKIQLH